MNVSKKIIHPVWNTCYTSRQSQALANDATYQDAFNRLVTKQEVAPVYYIIGGIRPGEGAVITRDRVKPVDIWQLDPQNGR